MLRHSVSRPFSEGEKSSALNIGYIEIENRPPISERNELIELSKLPAYVKWKKNKTTA